MVCIVRIEIGNNVAGVNCIDVEVVVVIIVVVDVVVDIEDEGEDTSGESSKINRLAS